MSDIWYAVFYVIGVVVGLVVFTAYWYWLIRMAIRHGMNDHFNEYWRDVLDAWLADDESDDAEGSVVRYH
jgi:hypothetical protein